MTVQSSEIFSGFDRKSAGHGHLLVTKCRVVTGLVGNDFDKLSSVLLQVGKKIQANVWSLLPAGRIIRTAGGQHCTAGKTICGYIIIYKGISGHFSSMQAAAMRQKSL